MPEAVQNYQRDGAVKLFVNPVGLCQDLDASTQVYCLACSISWLIEMKRPLCISDVDLFLKCRAPLVQQIAENPFVERKMQTLGVMGCRSNARSKSSSK
jgi:hypothetical protein